ncbi:hypothetical protein ARTSIC4J27_2088 [Pseudarthrobacter siccitolerans]|jgi:hypothetical protein|uniref:Uncharacterized protein n=1 Tax=Pseudarthrobacter siccitolerans TaxID=861266 RepID=A0A024H290_9MICC|nr:hypothetical protein ARTSIC4J27_2088 [Pseudarthrobacter siccitolerans]
MRQGAGRPAVKLRAAFIARTHSLLKPGSVLLPGLAVGDAVEGERGP